MDSALFDPAVPVLVQGIGGRAGRTHAELMRRYGTNLVAGVAARAAGETIAGVPVFAGCVEAASATGAQASLVMVPPLEVRAAVEDALAAGIGLVVCVTEGVPVHDTLALAAAACDLGAVLIGPSTPGIAIPGRMKMGFLPDVVLGPGTIGVMSKSGTLSYEVGYRLAGLGLGQSLWIGVGGDPVKGTRFADLVGLFADHAETEALLVIGEIGGSEEEELADALARERFAKPVFALLAGATAPEGVMMGHAGALIEGARGTAGAKAAALSSAGVEVSTTIAETVARIVARLGAQGEHRS